ncbi:uncharacterized protein BYT42DRAFT_618771 [Radiomyces spectabilis]|uniref:uncharacterized protein n=1 Tax=Radiomyces spectabilis TaxID=64574 RepID=UPI00221F4497|nr:uncharacterized protein BYT42DRAFT_618771 [Radiomyces spectabilis]KAI8365402.1 hypothetical protein BYT42DRAFT_618771 [Radiomyces spectabilis]
MLYQQSIWECEVTGRRNLTYEQALESERIDDDRYRAEFRFCEVLRKRMLLRIQFQTVRLDALVNDLLNYFGSDFAVGEITHCMLGENIYLVRILDVLPQPHTGDYYRLKRNRPTKAANHVNDGLTSDTTESDEDDMPRQPNGRLRFPDAFLHPTPETRTEAKRESSVEMDDVPAEKDEVWFQPVRYRVQLIDKYGQPLEDFARIVEAHEIKRDKRSFCRFLIQRFIRECALKDSYVGAPWLIKPNVAQEYGISTTLPPHLQEAQDLAYAKARKRKAVKTPDEKEAEKRARKEETLLQKARRKEEKERQREERRKQSAIKYPIEDLDLPIYRKDPNINWTLIDLSPNKYPIDHVHIPYPSGGRPARPPPHKLSCLPHDLFEQFLAIWTFLSVFSKPLKLTPFSIDEFERGLFHNQHQPKPTVIVESYACLLNVIIRERIDETANETINGEVVEDFLDNLEQQEDSDNGSQDSSDDNQALKRLQQLGVERGWRDQEQLRIIKDWDDKEIRSSHDRRGWETKLIGCLNDVATPDIMPGLDAILAHLVPRQPSTAAEREKQFPTLTLQQKLAILGFLVDVVNESNLIKEYMEQCQEQLTEFRRQKVELNKESKQLIARRIQLDRRDRLDDADKESEEDEDEDESSEENETSESSSDDESNDESSGDISSRRRGRGALSRQEKVKQKQKEREELEAMRKRMYEKQREAARARNLELKQKAEDRRKLEEEEKALRKKEEDLERDMRRYTSLRIKLLGRDRFYNRYFFFDNICHTDTYGTGRLYIQSPSDVDIQMMMERDYATDLPDQPWGRGGGCQFTLELMKAQGLQDESQWLERRMLELSGKKEHDPSSDQGWWCYYSEPDEIQALLAWLNPKGHREFKLKNEILKQQTNIMESLKKRAEMLSRSESSSKRVTRGKTSSSKEPDSTLISNNHQKTGK